MSGPDQPVIRADILATRADLHAMVRRLTWRFAAMVAVAVVLVFAVHLATSP
jgi:hypothetical protein